MVESVTARCLCGAEDGDEYEYLGIPMIGCGCGIERQKVEVDEAGLAAWYRTEYLSGVYYHSEEQDIGVAGQRLDAYDLGAPVRILDVGTANGAFVSAARDRGHDAWGQDLAEQSESQSVYIGKLDEIAFPAASFEVVTCHDVLEHVPDPAGFLHEIGRILEPGGRFFLDFPAFHDRSGTHHWKRTEHLWMLDPEQLADLVESQGFEVEAIRYPVESKVVFYCRSKLKVSDASILVPPGIGDGYWVAAKLPAFLEEKGLRLPTVYVHDSGPRRSGNFWASVPFVRFGGYRKIERGEAWRRAYDAPGQAVQEDVEGIDYFVSFNGVLDGGRSLSDALPGPIDWHVQIFRSKARDAAAKRFAKDFAPYVVVSFWDRGFYADSYLPHFPETEIIATLRRIADAGLRVVVMGAAFDRGSIATRLSASDERFIDLVGETSFAELVGLVESASAVLGFPAGNTLLGPYLGTPSVLLWSDHFPASFREHCVSPDAPHYPIDVRTATSREVVAEVIGVAR